MSTEIAIPIMFFGSMIIMIMFGGFCHWQCIPKCKCGKKMRLNYRTGGLYPTAIYICKKCKSRIVLEGQDV